MWTEYTEDVTPQQMEVQPKAHNSVSDAPKVKNPVQRNSKELNPPYSKNYCTLLMHISVNLMTEDN